ncbi:Hsp20/alpha crystallin family protein [Halioxenophilus sp. WMMB6]|uniref:Hsp20/alpha crystallin family protein n=1 Tax=Halioxenophilus sp. WMMB6 TaxID=3073815 RepID=UPI00295E62FA|nr:Hsp20/alpha crystallin family protein [Halioxenophilus sp. WMMB6]
MNLQKLNPWNWFTHEESHQPTVHHSRQGVQNDAHFYSANSHPVTRLHQEFDRLFDELFGAVGNPVSATRNWSPFDDTFRPNIDISGTTKNYQIKLDVPGLSAKDISIDIAGDVLTIKGEIHHEQENKEKQFYRMERRYGSFQRTLALPEDAIAEDIQAQLTDGVLKLEIPRHPVTKQDNARRIEISEQHH